MSSCEFIGRTTLDLCYSTNRFPKENSKISAYAFLALAGGPAANAAATYSHLGGSAFLTSAIGRSPWAEFARADLAHFAIEIVDALNGIGYDLPVSSIITNRMTGSRTILNTPIADAESDAIRAARELPDLPFQDCALVDGFLFELFAEHIRQYRQTGKDVVLDAGSWRANTADLLPFVTNALCSEHFSYNGRLQHDATIESLHRIGIGRVAITRGERSILASEDGVRTEIAVPTVTAIDTLGAGDIFHGAFCYYFRESNNLVTALTQASKVAARSCEHFGTRAWMSTSLPTE